VSLEGYDDAAVEDSNMAPEETEHERPESSQAYTSEMHEEGDETMTEKMDPVTSDNEDLLSSPSMAHAHSTPRMPGTGKGKSKQITGPPPPQPSFADYPSPYETLRREMEGKSGALAGAGNPTTPGKGHALPDMSMTPDSSPFVLDKSGNGPPSTAQKNKDTILHQGILNKTYRVAWTPHTARKQKNLFPSATKTPGTANRTRSRWVDETLSSPDEPEPQLRAEIFSSPVRPPRTPGVSVQTPGLKKKFAQVAKAREGRHSGVEAEQFPHRQEKFRDEPTSNFTKSLRAQWESDEEDDDLFGMSPPKTIHFDLPKRPLLQTPGTYSLVCFIR
jgi:DASH complex subunit ASK1